MAKIENVRIIVLGETADGRAVAECLDPDEFFWFVLGLKTEKTSSISDIAERVAELLNKGAKCD